MNRSDDETAQARPDAAKAPTISIITTCKGRLHHLTQSALRMAAEKPDELIIVDYDCPDRVGDWAQANLPQAKVVRAGQADGRFNVARARNLGAAAATGEWLYFVDADVLLKPGVMKAVRTTIAPGHFYQPKPDGGPIGIQVYGTFLCRRADFAAIGGYDEVIEGWGREDKDLYLRLQFRGVRETFYPVEFLDVIPHDDSERNILSGMHRWQNEVLNSLYSEAKLGISIGRGGRGNLPMAERRKLFAECRGIVDKWYKAGAKEPLVVRFPAARLPVAVLASKMRLRSELTLTLVLQPYGYAHGNPETAPMLASTPPQS
jgi:glycosyltransferase involved in cell wall biosynthesis